MTDDDTAEIRRYERKVSDAPADLLDDQEIEELKRAAADAEEEGNVLEDSDRFDDDDRMGPTLRQVAAKACKRIDVGAAVLPKPLFTADVEDYDGSEELRDVAQSIPDTHYARILRQEFNAIVVEHHLKWAPLCVSEPGPLPGENASDRLGRYDFHHADSIVDWALAHDIQKIKGA
jgi:hypothetical protein